ncbi:hypothetical protein [Actinopolymorpha pittospori]
MVTGTTAGLDPNRWVQVRRLLNERRHELAGVASGFYVESVRAAGTPLLCRPEWLPSCPIELSEIALGWVADPAPPVVDGRGLVTAHVRPVGAAGRPFETYAETMGALARPAVFEDRIAYRLLSAELAGGSPAMTFCRGSYFEGVNVGEAAAHELAAAWRPNVPIQVLRDQLPLRQSVGDPCELGQRSALPAVSTLTIRHDRVTGEASFILHWRDPAKVAHAGGLHQVMPVGVFQPVNDAPASRQNDFDLWRGMVREYSEELLGTSEEYNEDDHPLDYGSWPFYRAMTNARKAGDIRVHCLGLGVDPLTWATDILTVAVFDSACFDELFTELVSTNSEGIVVREKGVVGIPFEQQHLAPLLDGTKAIQAAGAAALALAHQFRDALLVG